MIQQRELARLETAGACPRQWALVRCCWGWDRMEPKATRLRSALASQFYIKAWQYLPLDLYTGHLLNQHHPRSGEPFGDIQTREKELFLLFLFKGKKFLLWRKRIGCRKTGKKEIKNLDAMSLPRESIKENFHFREMPSWRSWWTQGQRQVSALFSFRCI